MRVLTFQPRFHPSIRDGSKTTTIRGKSKAAKKPKPPPVPGEILSLRAWKGKPYRSKQKQLGRLRPCTSSRPVRIYKRTSDLGLVYDGRMITSPQELDIFAKRDGFLDWPDLSAWFTQNHGISQGEAFEGYVIEWK